MQRRFSSLLGIVAALFLLAGCSSMKVQDFAANEPKLVLEDYFLGQTKAWGIFEDRFGNMRRQFVVDILGTWDEANQTLTLVEDFVYADGEKSQRIWTIKKLGPNRYQGTAPDVIGIADGTVAGNALFWEYDMDLKVGESFWRVRFSDWMWLQPGDALINRARVKRWGFEIGEVTLFFQRVGNAETASDTRPRLAAD
jgi:hypothetical protein